MEIYFVFFLSPAKKEGNPTHIARIGKAAHLSWAWRWKPTLKPKLCQRVQSCQYYK